MNKLDQIDLTFTDDLKRSQIAVRRTADYLSALGFPVIVEPTFVRPNSDAAPEYADSGDLRAVITVETKHRPDIEFTCAEDFPYPTVIVDKASTFDRKRPRPFYYFIWNADYSVCIIVDVAKTVKRWRKVERYAHGRTSAYYELDTARCVFRSV